MDPKSKLLVVVDVGSRTLAMAHRVVHQVTQVLARDCIPLFLTDGLQDYATALLTHFAQFLAVCSRSKWSRHLTKSPLLRHRQDHLSLLERVKLPKVAQELKEAQVPRQVRFAEAPKHP